MSGSLAQQPIWTPPVIATIAYRLVMIIVSIAFIWKKYRRPARQIDGNSALLTAHSSPLRSHSSLRSVKPQSSFTNLQSCFPPSAQPPLTQFSEEQLIGVLLPTNHRPLNRTRSTPHSTTSRGPTPPRRQTHPPTLRKVISAQIEDIIQSALGIDDEDNVLDIEVSLSSNSSRPESSVAEGAGSSLDNFGLDVEPGDMGLRHRSADGMVGDKKTSRCDSSKEEL
jgi:hypothetical protein